MFSPCSNFCAKYITEGAGREWVLDKMRVWRDEMHAKILVYSIIFLYYKGKRETNYESQRANACKPSVQILA